MSFVRESLPLISDRLKTMIWSRVTRTNIPRIDKPVTEDTNTTIFVIDRLCDGDADTVRGSGEDDGFNECSDDFFGEGAADGLVKDDGCHEGGDDYFGECAEDGSGEDDDRDCVWVDVI